MHRIAALCLALAATLPAAMPAAAWEARIGLVCVLTHATEAAETRLTYDPAVPEYTITIRLRGGAWPDAPTFSMRFDGPQGRVISTDRHVLSEGGAALTVTDSGFGNVLDGLQFNDTAIAFAGDTAVSLPLDGAAPAVADFRECRPAAGV
jgi:hypothetical protein